MNKKIKTLNNVAFICCILYLVFAFVVMGVDLFGEKGVIQDILFICCLGSVIVACILQLIVKIYECRTEKQNKSKEENKNEKE